jgi:hypothetical protein
MEQLPAGECYNALYEICAAPDGHVASATITRPSGDPRGDEAMTRAILSWRYPPRARDSQAFCHGMDVAQCRAPSLLSDAALLATLAGDAKGGLPDETYDQEAPFTVQQSDDRMRAAKTCYGLTLLRLPRLAGTMTVRWTLSPTGAVKNVETIADSLGDPDLAACVRTEVAGWRFPGSPSAGDVTMSFRFVFGHFAP